MFRTVWGLLLISVFQQACTTKNRSPEVKINAELSAFYDVSLVRKDSTVAAVAMGDSSEFIKTRFAGPEITPSPACLAVAPTGEVFVGVDMIGSLGKDPGKGSIIKLTDSDNDGKAEKHTVFAEVNNPRGLLPLGNRLFVLHTVFSEETGKATGMDLVVFEDKDQDGVADGPSTPLIKHISNARMLQRQGTDHATNGIQMGIDGWIYIAVGDFGFHDAVDRSGKKLTMLGGGIVRVRPDGTGMEIYTHGMRNIYDMAIDPFMNIFTRGNTNDGGGWNIRFSHHIQSGEYGYPVLFKHFTDEIIPALADLGGGSGTGALFLDDDTWPAKYNHVPLMADWGRSQLYMHRVSLDGSSFRQTEEEFIGLSQITDVDMDGSGRMYLSAWDGAGYTGNPNKGFVVRVVPQNWEYKTFPDLEQASVQDLAGLLTSGSAVTRLYAQQELLTRPEAEAMDAAWEIASDQSLPLYARVAGIYTYAQASCEKGIDNLVKLTKEDQVREFALRALADRKTCTTRVPIEPFIEGLNDPLERVRVAAIVGLGRLGRKEAAGALLQVTVPDSLEAPANGREGPHAAPNPSVIPAHLAVRALVALEAVEACVDAIGSEYNQLALWTLRYMHDPRAVEGLIGAYDRTTDKKLKKQLLITLSRLYKKEAAYDGSWWWSTRPDTHGPYYKPVTWEASAKIKAFLLQAWKESGAGEQSFFAELNERHQMGIMEFGGAGDQGASVLNEQQVDLESIKNKKGQVGEAAIEDVMMAIAAIKGDPALGEKLFVQQGCVACHSVESGSALKGPFMGQIGSIMNREQIAESILRPSASIAQGFASVLVSTKDGKSVLGFITKESSEEIILRDITGAVHTIKTKEIQKREKMKDSVMPPGLANSLSYEEFASLVTYLSQQK